MALQLVGKGGDRIGCCSGIGINSHKIQKDKKQYYDRELENKK